MSADDEVKAVLENEAADDEVPAAGDEGDANDGGDANSPNESRSRSQASKLVDLAIGTDLFHTPDGEEYTRVAVDDHAETLRLRSKSFKVWLGRQFYVEYGRVASAQALQDAINTLSGEAVFKRAEHQVYTRLARRDGAIYLDLGDAKWRAVRIDAAGWAVDPRPPVRFRRTPGMLPLPDPIHGGEWATLKKFLNVNDTDWKLAVAWLVAAYCDKGPYTILAVHGEQGSAKSTTVRVLRSLIDPNSAPLRTTPRNEHELAIAASKGWVIALDNVSQMQEWLSDALCRLSTGAGLSARQLYTDDDEVIFNAMRPAILNGITEVAVRGDLLDRHIILHQPRIPDDRRRDEATLWLEFDKQRPAILGVALDAVSTAIKNLPTTQLDRMPRMADFVRWVVAAEPKLPWQAGEFVKTYQVNREDASTLALEASVLTDPLRNFVSAAAKTISITAANLLKELDARVSEDTRKQKEWPKNGRALAGALRRLAPNLRSIGIDASFDNREAHTGRRLIDLQQVDQEQVRKFASPPSPSSPSLSKTVVDGDANGPQGDAKQGWVTQKVTQIEMGDDGDAKMQTRSNATLDDGLCDICAERLDNDKPHGEGKCHRW